MSLTPAQIKALLELPSRKRGGSRKKKSVDFLDPETRNYEQWFKLSHHMLDQETGYRLECDNPTCQDPRPARGNAHLMMVAEVLGVHMCRNCFIGGYLVGPGKDQTSFLPDESFDLNV
jgi:hypothetical protein